MIFENGVTTELDLRENAVYDIFVDSIDWDADIDVIEEECLPESVTLIVEYDSIFEDNTQTREFIKKELENYFEVGVNDFEYNMFDHEFY